MCRQMPISYQFTFLNKIHRGTMKLMITLLVVGAVLCEDLGRRRAVPVMFVRGSNYDIGFDVGRTFGALIKDFIANCDRLRDFEKQYKTEAGREAYEKTIATLRARYPHYLKEVQGVADGAKVPFQKLFLLQLDDIIETINENNVGRNDTGGCSSIGVNRPNVGVLGHTEDAFSETLNHFYILHAHVIPDPEDIPYGATEEKFASLCYAGELPGYTMGFNTNGMVFSINTLSPRDLKPGNTPRTFITRAILGARSVDDVKRILLDDGVGTANGFSLNLLWTEPNGQRELYNIEVSPDLNAPRSHLNIFDTKSEPTIHCNKYLRTVIPEVRGAIIDSSSARLAAIHSHTTPQTREDVVDIISDISGKEYRVFQAKEDAVVKTIAAGVFDLEARTWSIFIDRPNSSEPVAVLPITFKKIP